MWRSLITRLQALNNERLALLITLPIAIFWGIGFAIMGEGVIGILNYFGTLLSISNYFGRQPDAWTNIHEEINKDQYYITRWLDCRKVKSRFYGPFEKYGTSIGLMIGFFLSIYLIPFPLLGLLGCFIYLILILGGASLIGSLFNRVGSILDFVFFRERDFRLKEECILMGFFLSLALLSALAIILFVVLNGSFPFAFIPALTAPFFALLKVCFLLRYPMIIVIVSSLFISLGDYLAKAYCYSVFKLGIGNENLRTRVKNNQYDYGGAFLGALLGIVLGIIVTTFCIPGLPIGLALCTAALTVLIAMNMVMGICSRTGRVMDGLVKPCIGDPLLHESKEVLQPSLEENLSLDNKETKSQRNLLRATTGVHQRFLPAKEASAKKIIRNYSFQYSLFPTASRSVPLFFSFLPRRVPSLSTPPRIFKKLSHSA